MNSVEILKDFFFIERGYLNGNHFVYNGTPPVLIDTAYIADFSETENLINNLGVKLIDIKLIVSTHTHCDHIGGNKWFYPGFPTVKGENLTDLICTGKLI